MITYYDKLKEIMWNSKLIYNDRVKLIKQLKEEKWYKPWENIPLKCIMKFS